MRRGKEALVLALITLATTSPSCVAFIHREHGVRQTGAETERRKAIPRQVQSEHPLSLYEQPTVSFALDRIDQRDLPLDETYRHRGTGRGVKIYVFDGGISQTHPEIQGRVRLGFTGFPDDPKVCNPHGTAVAGAAAGSTLGVAPEAEIVDVKIIQCEKLRGTIRAIVDATSWVIMDHADNPGPAVANWSFIADTTAHIGALDTAVAKLRSAGIAVIVSAGNFYIDACRSSPSNAPGAIAVGDMTLATETMPNGTTRVVDERAYSTAYGPCIDLYAPGDSVLLPSLDRERAPISQLWNGTSMSAAYVSGAVALYLEAHPNSSAADVSRWLGSNATVEVLKGSETPLARLLYVGEPAMSIAQLSKRRPR